MTFPLTQESDVDEVGFRRFQRAQAKRAPLASKPETVEEMATTYGLSTGAANLLLVEHDFPPELRPFLDAVVGVCGDRQGEWFEANDELLASHADKSLKTISRWREKYAAWMKSKNIALVDIERHEFKKGETPKPHRYRVNFSQQVAETLLEAEKMPEWKTHKGLALEESARNVKASDLLPRETTDRKRTRKARGDAEALIARKIRTAKTLVKKSLDIYKATGKHATVDAEAFAELDKMMAQLREIVEAQEGADLSSTYKEEVLDKLDPDGSPVGARLVSVDDARTGETEGQGGGTGHFVYNPPLDIDGSTVCGEISEAFDVSEYAYRDADGDVVVKFPAPKNSSPAIEAAIYAEGRRLESQARAGGDG
ncbi:MAG: hypothetical protein H0X14_00025 [Acidobacteria bacterium]|nr:hypothetical protein [Acidobacteriota bacterium]